jgi:hypothetical protein
MTPEEKRDKIYLDNSGEWCFNCHKTDSLDWEILEQEGTMVYQRVICLHCGSYWYDDYRLIGTSGHTRRGEEE